MKNNNSTTNIGRYIVHRLWTFRNDEDRTTGYYILDLINLTELHNGIRVFPEHCTDQYQYLRNVTRYPAHCGDLVKSFVDDLNNRHRVTVFTQDLDRINGLGESL